MSEEDATSQDDGGTEDDPESTSSTGEANGAHAMDDEAKGENHGTLLEHVEQTDPETIAQELQSLRERAETAEEDRDALAAEVEDLEERIKRIQADFQNYKKRTERRREEETARATQDLVERLLPVRENLARAVDQNSETDIRDGVQATLGELDTVLENEGVSSIDPSPGDDVDPTRHEVVHREDEDADSIASVFRRGYEMGGTVIRSAQVTVGTVEEGSDSADTEPDQEAS